MKNETGFNFDNHKTVLDCIEDGFFKPTTYSYRKEDEIAIEITCRCGKHWYAHFGAIEFSLLWQHIQVPKLQDEELIIWNHIYPTTTTAKFITSDKHKQAASKRQGKQGDDYYNELR